MRVESLGLNPVFGNLDVNIALNDQMKFLLWQKQVSLSRPTNYLLYPSQETSGNSGNTPSALLSFSKSPQPGANALGPHVAVFSSWLGWFPGSLEFLQLPCRSTQDSEGFLSPKMLLFCCLPRTKVNTWASTHQLHCSEGFSDQLQHHKVNTSIECGSLSSGFLTWVGKGCGAASCLELLGSLEAEDLGCMKRSRFSLKISTESQPRKQNKIALLVTLQWERKPPTSLCFLSE